MATEYVGHDELLVLDQHAVRYNQHIAGRFGDALTGLVAEMPAGSHPFVIDFGAGIGTISRLFKASTGVSPLAVEIDAHQRRVLQERGIDSTPQLDTVAEGSVDFIFSSNVMEHIDDHIGTLRELHSRLRPGGRLALWVPAFPALWSSLDDRVGHFRRYTVPSMEQSLQAAGFTPLVCQYQDSVGAGLALAFKLVGSRSGALTAGPVRLFDRWLFPVSRVLDVGCHRWFGKNVFAVAVKR
jgi:SAM-dependent methyltransferase